jgi:hypothetical protein
MTGIRMDETEDILFNALQARGIATAWHGTTSPRELLRAECKRLFEDVNFRGELIQYLKANPCVSQSIEIVVAQLAFSAGVHWTQASKILQPLAFRGWCLARWQPTFLIIDGPLGHLLRCAPSPVAERLKHAHEEFPMLASARDNFNKDFFRRVRNGFAHLSFVWVNKRDGNSIQIFDGTSNKIELKETLSTLEAEALHYLSAITIQILDEELIRKINNPNVMEGGFQLP